MLSTFAFLVSFSIMCIFAASIDQMKRYIDNPCTGYVTIPPNIVPPINVPIAPCSYYSKCGLFAITQFFADSSTSVELLTLLFGLNR